jgi:phosphopantothenoylcysteine decarboxylase/phosphopantothenate--cysteine ligase
MIFKDKNILIGISGGIGVYKVVEIVSQLVKHGANVDIIMTKNAQEFVSHLTFQSISHNKVVTEMFDDIVYWEIEHISLAQKADIVLIAPATYNIIGKVASGIADDFLTTTIAATKAPVIFVPAMNTNMYENEILSNNIKNLRKSGYLFIEPDEGRMACGTYGKGRFPKKEIILDILKSTLINTINFELNKDKQPEKINIMITAGPTREAIDPVRYITNKSSGKMGYSIANVAYEKGDKVKLVSGPVEIEAENGIEVVNVVTADEMYEEVINTCKEFEIIILVAAVSDYKVKVKSKNKIKKNNEEFSLNLIKNPDIAFELGKIKKNFILVGFCAETENLIENAKSKLIRKNFDFIVANDVTKDGAGFGTDTNIVTILDKEGNVYNLDKRDKKEIAEFILKKAKTMYYDSIN